MSLGHLFKTLNTTPVASKVSVHISSMSLSGASTGDRKFMVWLQRKGKSRGTALVRAVGCTVEWGETVSLSCTLYRGSNGEVRRKRFDVVVIWNSCTEEAPGQVFGKVTVDVSETQASAVYQLEECSEDAHITISIASAPEDAAAYPDSPSKYNGVGRSVRERAGGKKPVGGFGNAGARNGGGGEESKREERARERPAPVGQRGGYGGYGGGAENEDDYSTYGGRRGEGKEEEKSYESYEEPRPYRDNPNRGGRSYPFTPSPDAAPDRQDLPRGSPAYSDRSGNLYRGGPDESRLDDSYDRDLRPSRRLDAGFGDRGYGGGGGGGGGGGDFEDRSYGGSKAPSDNYFHDNAFRGERGSSGGDFRDYGRIGGTERAVGVRSPGRGGGGAGAGGDPNRGAGAWE